MQEVSSTATDFSSVTELFQLPEQFIIKCNRERMDKTDLHMPKLLQKIEVVRFYGQQSTFTKLQTVSERSK